MSQDTDPRQLEPIVDFHEPDMIRRENVPMRFFVGETADVVAFFEKSQQQSRFTIHLMAESAMWDKPPGVTVRLSRFTDTGTTYYYVDNFHVSGNADEPGYELKLGEGFESQEDATREFISRAFGA